MEHGADLFGARQLMAPMAGFHTSTPGDGDSRPADITEVLGDIIQDKGFGRNARGNVIRA